MEIQNTRDGLFALSEAENIDDLTLIEASLF